MALRANLYQCQVLARYAAQASPQETKAVELTNMDSATGELSDVPPQTSQTPPSANLTDADAKRPETQVVVSF